MIDHLDHLVLTTAFERECIHFYTEVLGMQLESFVGGTPPVERKAFKFGNQKINLHVRGREFDPKAHLPVPGALDLCFIAAVPLATVIARLEALGVPIVEGPVQRTGATSKIRSVYVRDPDLNLIEISQPID
ncbi:MAG: VOC family protein [Burkholderiaceae bacterium]